MTGSIVAYVDYNTGNYVVDTHGGFSVIESFGGYTPRNTMKNMPISVTSGLQTIYNLNNDYFTSNRVVDAWLSWSDAMYVLDQISYGR